jgi:hypothetical protein
MLIPSAFIVSIGWIDVVVFSDPLPDLSLEFLMGRALDNAMLNTGMKDVAVGKFSPIKL